jgi:cell fate regulator YaaT (PSP1 superfamily)
VEFKGHRKGYFYNAYYHDLKPNDLIIVEAERGEDLGTLSKAVPDESHLDLEEKPKSILRPVTDNDRSQLKANRQAEEDAIIKCAKLVTKHGLPMKLIGAEYQHDRNKLTFYFTADCRVDFRALVRDLAAIYKTRIELRQIGVRDAARRLGGFGVCGRAQCCCTFLHKFDPISTQFAREQNLSLNPSKISGNCGRLLCCLAYEKEHYLEQLSRFPERGESYVTEKGEGVIEEINIFKQYMVVRHPNGEMEKVTLTDIRKKNRHKKSFFKNWQIKRKDSRDNRAK